MQKFNYEDCLNAIEPKGMDYSEWLSVQIAAKRAGLSYDVVDKWNQRDSIKYDKYSNYQTWEAIDENPEEDQITAGTLVYLAKQYGYTSNTAPDKAFDWGDTVSCSPEDVEPEVLPATITNPSSPWNPAQEMIDFLQAVYKPTDTVCIVNDWWREDNTERWKPTKGFYIQVQELIDNLNRCNGDVGMVIGDGNAEAGALIIDNALDGDGRKNENVTDYKHYLVESDTDDLETQLGILKASNAPISTIVYSGNKSMQALVRVDALDSRQYKERVTQIQKFFENMGLTVDHANRNPARLCRLPGVMRNGKRQCLIATHVGTSSFEEWEQYLMEETDDLPDPVSAKELIEHPLPLAPALIEGILRVGHKAIYSGGSKAKKSFTLLELAMSVASGTKWLGHQCRQGKVLYINLEIDAPDVGDRIAKIFKARPEIKIEALENMEVMNWRGHADALERLAPRIVYRCRKAGADPEHGGFSLVIIDPIYKVQDGDENSNGDIARFCNQIDYIANELKASVVYCHHHSKGSQANKNAIDRMSGAGTFARDADAIIDCTPIAPTREQLRKARDPYLRAICQKYQQQYGLMLPEGCSGDALSMSVATQLYDIDASAGGAFCEEVDDMFNRDLCGELPPDGSCASDFIHAAKISFILRSFRTPKPINVWFDFPIAVVDYEGVLDEASLDGGGKTNDGSGLTKRETADTKLSNLVDAYDIVQSITGGDVTKNDLAEYLNCSPKTIGNWINGFGSEKFRIERGKVLKTAI